MPRANSCCNPLNRKSHKCVYKNVQQINECWIFKFKNFIGKFICGSCKAVINSNKTVKNVEPVLEKSIGNENAMLVDKQCASDRDSNDCD